MARRTTRTVTPAPPACFLCGRTLAAEDLEDAFERLRDDVLPSVPEFAHAACAGEAGLADGDGDEDEGLPRRGA